MSSFLLKIIAAAAMLIDHAGLLLFPGESWMRIVGRLAFPIFAYCIAEGFRYTRSRGKYFLRLFLLGGACQIVYYVAAGDTLIGILLVFSVSVLLMWLGDLAKTAFREDRPSRCLWLAAAVAAVIAVAWMTAVWEFDYGFFGIMLPVWVSLFDEKEHRLAALGFGLGALCLDSWIGGAYRQTWSLLTLPILTLYNGKPGRYRMKWFFYVFYPAHLALLQCLAWIMPR